MDWSKVNELPVRVDPSAPPRLATLFRVVGVSGRPLRCATYQVATGIELRLGYEDDEFAVLQTQLFRSDQDEALAQNVAEWCGAFDRVGGFKDLGVLD